MDQQKNSKKLPKIVTQVDDFGRKKFALKQNDSEPQNDQGEQKFIDTGRYTSTLIGRQQKIDTDKYLGKIEGTKKKKKTEVFYCEVCKVGFKCDIAYITHINSPSHNRKLGMNMRVEAVSVGTVAEKLAKMAQEKDKSKQEKIMQKKLGKNWESELMKKQHQDESKQAMPKDQHNVPKIKGEHDKTTHNNCSDQNVKKQVKQQICQVKIDPNEEQEGVESSEDQDLKMMKQLGLPTSFGTKKKKY